MRGRVLLTVIALTTCALVALDGGRGASWRGAGGAVKHKRVLPTDGLADSEHRHARVNSRRTGGQVLLKINNTYTSLATSAASWMGGAADPGLQDLRGDLEAQSLLPRSS